MTELVKVVDGTPKADSRTVAEVFNKRHDDVLRAIRNLDCSDEFRARNFAETPYVHPQNHRTYNIYEMTRDGFTFLAMGFTGTKAALWKESYIEAFNKLERQVSAPLDLNNPAALRTALLGYSEKVLELEHKVEKDAPKVTFFDQFCDADGLYNLQNAARALGAKPNLFIRWLKSKYLFYQGKALVPYVQYRHKGLFDVVNRIIDDKARPQTFVTPRGLEYFAERLPENVRIDKAS